MKSGQEPGKEYKQSWILEAPQATILACGIIQPGPKVQ